ncbi:MAG: reverse transcriptase N-terminal domain-containing protein [Cyanobacteria bacterium J06635_10]
MNTSNTQENLMVEWKNINWRKVERMVFKLQKRIYRASKRGDVKTVRKLQKTLMKSWFAKLLAVRKVTQDNKGRRTAGIDGKKSYTPGQRLQLVSELRLSSKAKPTRRVWISKPGKPEKRPLGIPTMYDRALQTSVKMALEPEWEAKEGTCGVTVFVLVAHVTMLLKQYSSLLIRNQNTFWMLI